MLKQITLIDFRNHRRLELSELENLVIIKGDNAVGKTNIIEAIQLVTMIESFKKPQWQAVCYQGSQTEQLANHQASINAQVLSNSRELEVKVEIGEGKRNYYLQGNRRKPNELKGLMPAVLFTPDDLSLIKSSSSARRDQIDSLGMQLSNTYANLLQEYLKVLKQRNKILKESPGEILLLDAWDEHLVMLGAKVYLHRKQLFQQLLDIAVRIYSELAEEVLSGEYLPSWGEGVADDIELISGQFQAMLCAERGAETASGHTRCGPHRDDLKYYLDAKDARVYASQGQQRTIALALKLAERELILQIKGVEPIILLDDVMSELDESRRQSLLRSLSSSSQTFITTTNIGYFSEDVLGKAQIIELRKQ